MVNIKWNVNEETKSILVPQNELEEAQQDEYVQYLVKYGYQIQSEIPA